nr:hypothetical protein [Tanacetum cinerariifolium]
MSTLAYVDLETITQADGAQSSRTLILFPDDPYVAVRQTHLVDTDTKSNPEEAPSEAEEWEPLGSRVPLMSEEFEASKPSGFKFINSIPFSIQSSIFLKHNLPLQPRWENDPGKLFTAPEFIERGVKSPDQTPLSSSSLTLLVQKRYRGTTELILDTDSEGDELANEDTEEDVEDESQGLDDEGQGLDDEGQGLDDEGQGLEDEGPSMEEEVAPEGQQQAVPVVDTAASEPLGQSSRSVPEQEGVERISAFRQPTLVTWVDPADGTVYTDIPNYVPLAAPVQTPPSLEWSLGSLPVSPLSLVVPSPIASPVATPAATISVDEDQFIKVGAQLELHGSILQDHTQRLDALPPTLFEGYDRDLRDLYSSPGAVRDEIFSQRYMFRSLELEQERATVTFSVIRSLILALEAWSGQTNAQRATLWHAIFDI